MLSRKLLQHAAHKTLKHSLAMITVTGMILTPIAAFTRGWKTTVPILFLTITTLYLIHYIENKENKLRKQITNIKNLDELPTKELKQRY